MVDFRMQVYDNSAMAEDTPSVCLERWPDRPLHLPDFHQAALSPADHSLLLLSREGDVVSFPGAADPAPGPWITLLRKVSCLAWAHCQKQSQQLLFTAGDEGLAVHADDPGSSKNLKDFNSCLAEAELQDRDPGLWMEFCLSAAGRIFSTKFSSASFCRLARLGLGNQEADPATYGVVDILSSPSHRLVALVFGKAGGIIEAAVSDEIEKFIKDLFVVLVVVENAGLRFVACQKNSEQERGRWVDFELSSTFLVGLKEGGQAFVWDGDGGLVFSIMDVRRYKQLPVLKGGKESLWSGFSRTRSWRDGSEGLLDARGLRSLSQEPVAHASSRPGHDFRYVAVTSDCCMMAAMDVQGFVYLVSLAGHLSGPPSASLPLAAWGVAGLDIGSYVEYGAEERRSRHDGLALSRCESRSRRRPREVVCCFDRSNERRGLFLSPYEVIVISRGLDGDVSMMHEALDVCGESVDDIKVGNKRRASVHTQALPFKFGGSVCLVTAAGLHVVLPPVATSSRGSVVKGRAVAGAWWPAGATFEEVAEGGRGVGDTRGRMRDWEAEVLDRALIYDGASESEHLCVQNEWSLSLLTLRRLELGLSFIRIDEIELALEALIQANSSKVGVPRVLFVAMELLITAFQGDKDISRSSSRLLAVAASFATRLIHQQGWLSLSNINCGHHLKFSSGLSELAGFLEFIRGLQNSMVSRTRDHSHSEAEAVPALAPKPKVERVVEGYGNAMEQGDELSNGMHQDWRIVAVENCGDMLWRWEKEKVDAVAVVKDALEAGRVALAVVQLQAYYAKENVEAESDDLFQEVQDIGRGIVYQLLCEGKTESALGALYTLGEDVETALRQLAFGTTRRDLRDVVSAQLRKHGWLGTYEAQLLERMQQLEGVYPVSTFWTAYKARRKFLAGIAKAADWSDDERLQLSVGNQTIECGNVDGVVLGSWNVIGMTTVQHPSTAFQDPPLAGYFCGAAIWLHPWDKTTFERLLLDQPGITRHSVPWEIQLDYHISRHNWPQVSSLLDHIPPSALECGQLEVTSHLDFEEVKVVIPGVQILSIASDAMFTLWMRQMVSDKLSRKGIFMQSRWNGTTELVALLGRGDRLFSHCGSRERDEQPRNVDLHESTIKGVQELMVLHCVQYSFPHLLSLHVDQQELNRDEELASRMLAIADGCNWASALLLYYMEGCEYEAILANAKAMVDCGSDGFKCPRVEDVDNVFHRFDRLSAAGGEMLAFATAMYTPLSLQTYLWSGLHANSLDLSPNLSAPKRTTKFPTLWKHLADSTVSRGGGIIDISLEAGDSATNLAEYLAWWKGLFCSSMGDISLVELLPPSFPQNVRRFIQLSTEPDLESLRKVKTAWDENLEDGPEKWEALIQASVERDLYVKHPEESESRVLYLLRQGRGIAAFQYLSERRMQYPDLQGLESSSALTPSEQKDLAPIVLLAIRQYGNLHIVAACVCFLELCGVSAALLRIVVSSLQRICRYLEESDEQIGGSPENRLNSASSQMRRLVEDYVTEVATSDDLHLLLGKPGSHRYRRAAFTILEVLEKAFLKEYCRARDDKMREVQKIVLEFSEQWALVTAFCHAHHLPVSCAYLKALAKDNNWVDFLAEAQAQGCSLEMLIPIVENHFSDASLRSHMLIVLRSLPSSATKDADCILSEDNGSKEELFALIAFCEKSNQPARTLLQKAKDLKWPLLTVVASCYDQVDPLLCFDVWLEIIAPAPVPSSLSSDLATPGGNDDPAEESKRVIKRHKSMLCASGQTSDVTKEKGRFLATESKIGDLDVDHESLARKVALFCEQQKFFPLLRGFELFSPASSLLPFIRFLQAFSQMRLSEASTHLSSFSVLYKGEIQSSGKSTWITKAAISAADAMLDACPSPYECRCLLQLLSAADFGDGGEAATRFRRLYWKMQLAESALQEMGRSLVGGMSMEDDELLIALGKEGRWDDARSWARQLDLKNSVSSSSALHSVTKHQAEAMVTDWKELLWDFPEERAALWGHCQSLFTKHSFPARRAGLFFLKHASELESQIPASELHKVFLLAFRWLSHPQANFPANLLGELETRVWILAVKADGETDHKGVGMSNGTQHGRSYVEASQSVIANANKVSQRGLAGSPAGSSRFPNSHGKQRRVNVGKGISSQDDNKTLISVHETRLSRNSTAERNNVVEQHDFCSDAQMEELFGGWKKRVAESESERVILDLLEAGHLSAAKQLQQSLSKDETPIELALLEAAQSVALSDRKVVLPGSVVEHLKHSALIQDETLSKSQALNILVAACGEGRGRGFCRRIEAISKVADVLGLPFSEAFEKHPTELIQLLALRGQDALGEAELLVATHTMPAGSIARILAESFLKGIVAAHRGGYLNSNSNGREKEEGPAPLVWRSSDFTRWAKLCPSEPEMGHALMRLVITGQEMPHPCEVELMILAHGFYRASACLDGLDVLVALASTRVDIYVGKGEFVCLARLLSGIADFHRWRFILDLLIENGRLSLVLEMYKEEAGGVGGESSGSGCGQGFRLAVLSALRRFNPHDVDALELVYRHFSMKHELADLQATRADKGLALWVSQSNLEQSEELLEVMRLYVEAGELYAAVDAGKQAKHCCGQASLISLQLRMPEQLWLKLSETNARRLLVEQPWFQEALIVAEAYGLNQPAEWVPVIWNHMLLYPSRFDKFLDDFVAALPLTNTMLLELTRFYRAEDAARADQIDFSKWLTPAGVQLESSLAKAFRSLLNHVPDIRFRIQLAITATGFSDVVDTCSRLLDKVPYNAGPLILKKGHGGAYLPIM